MERSWFDLCGPCRHYIGLTESNLGKANFLAFGRLGSKNANQAIVWGPMERNRGNDVQNHGGCIALRGLLLSQMKVTRSTFEKEYAAAGIQPTKILAAM
jgi:hypothetical protein